MNPAVCASQLLLFVETTALGSPGKASPQDKLSSGSHLKSRPTAKEWCCYQSPQGSTTSPKPDEAVSELPMLC